MASINLGAAERGLVLGGTGTGKRRGSYWDLVRSWMDAVMSGGERGEVSHDENGKNLLKRAGFLAF